MTDTVALIGAGNIGSRHLQALAQLHRDELALHVVEPSPAAQALAAERVAEVTDESPPIRFFAADSALPEQIDVAIVATTARDRRRAIESLCERSVVRYLILEKVLFQRLEDYDVVGQLLSERAIPTWVNLPRRIWDAYGPIERAARASSWIDYRMSGSQWDLGCLAVHYLDHIAFLARSQAISLDAVELSKNGVSLRRRGVQTFTGRLAGRCGKATFGITSLQCAGLPFQVTVETDSGRFCVLEGDDEIQVWRSSPATDWTYERSVHRVPLQSELTRLVVSRLLDTGRCGLTPYEEAAAVHRPLIAGVLGWIEKIDGVAAVACPIT